MPAEPLPANAITVSVPGEEWTGLWADQEPERKPARVLVWDLSGPPPDPAISLVVPPYLNPVPRLPVLHELPGLQVLQILSAGYDDVLPALPDGVTLCNAAGVHDASTAELALALALASLRAIPAAVRDAQAGQWRPGFHPALADRRVLVVGAGGVGAAIARRLEPFEVRLTRVASRARDDGAGHLHAAGELPVLLPEADVVFLACPLTPATRGLVDAAFLAAMPDRALLVNVARGPVVVTDALLAETGAGRLLAALDVTDPEPLPAGHPLWDSPGVLITPHLGGASSAFRPRARALLRAQFERYAAGQPLRNVVAGPPR